MVGIVNGIINYIFLVMDSIGVDYVSVLVDVSVLGYVEVDFIVDVEGYDVVVKVVILVFIVFYIWVIVDDVYCEGIIKVILVDFGFVYVLGCIIKLLLICECIIIDEGL